ncbi:MAG: molybdopterin molybdotransferase MoeA [Saprospiraceae bacterium]
MISVNEAFNILSSHSVDFGCELVPITKATGRILRENIYADQDMPPFDRVSMDGIAIRYEALEKGQRSFTISAMAAAGTPKATLMADENCIEIMTGSILPFDADTIVPYEWISINGNIATLTKENVIRGQNVHRKGKDRKKNDLLVGAGCIISPAEIGVLASVGKSLINVSRLPKILIISTGNELIDLDELPLPHQIRKSNVYQLQSALQAMNIHADTFHLQDDYDVIRNALKGYVNTYDILMISGGVSEGKYDFIPKALESIGVQQYFYKIKQRPGKPFWFGKHESGCAVFAVPGNPVSSFLCFIRFINPWIALSLQKKPSAQRIAILSEDVSFKPDLTYFLSVRLYQNETGQLIAVPFAGHGSGDLANLADTDAFIELPAGKDVFTKGEIYSIFEFSQCRHLSSR